MVALTAFAVRLNVKYFNTTVYGRRAGQFSELLSFTRRVVIIIRSRAVSNEPRPKRFSVKRIRTADDISLMCGGDDDDSSDRTREGGGCKLSCTIERVPKPNV